MRHTPSSPSGIHMTSERRKRSTDRSSVPRKATHRDGLRREFRREKMCIRDSTSSLAAAVEDLSEDNRRTMVKVDHVSMIFNMASEQLNSLKEYALSLIHI